MEPKILGEKADSRCRHGAKKCTKEARNTTPAIEEAIKDVAVMSKDLGTK